jgi:hypothetical protein
MGFGSFVVTQVKKRPALAEFLTGVARDANPGTVIVLEYPVESRTRWSQARPHLPLYDIINRQRSTYERHLRSFLSLTDDLAKIPERPPVDAPSVEPFWLNEWIPALDGVALYSFIALNKPKHYVEVGSGNSTKFARRAIIDHKLSTKIISIDPCPRADVDGICDRNIREAVENVGLETFDVLEANDILYIDSSHRVFMNSDVTALFLDVIPRLRAGVLVEIHDVTLPYDYPESWIRRRYSEQYLLAVYLLANADRCDIVLPGTFVSDDPELKGVLAPLWAMKPLKNAETHGCSFWLRTK